MSLFLKECKAILKSPVNFIYIAILCAFFIVVYIQEVDSSKYNPPRDEAIPSLDIGSMIIGQTISDDSHPYGMFRRVPDGDDNNTIRNGLLSILPEYISNSYRVYRLGGTRFHNFSASNQQRIYNILLDLLGADLMNAVTDESLTAESQIIGGAVFYPNLMKLLMDTEFDISIEDFNRSMRKIGNIVGGQNAYQDPAGFTSMKNATFEEAMASYNTEIVDKFFTRDGVSGGMARLFADRMGVVVLLLAGMVSIFYLLRDKRYWEVLSGKSISSIRLYMTKYIAVNAILLLPVLILGVIATVHAGVLAAEHQAAAFNYFAFFGVSFAWILPTIMFSTALAMLITVATDLMPVAVIALAVTWFVQATMPPFSGVYGLEKMIIRFNSELSFDLFRLAQGEITLNRIFYTGISIILVSVTVWLYGVKRGGKWNVRNLWRGMQKKS